MSKYDELCFLLNNKQYDVILLTEIKPKHGAVPDSSVMEIQGYKLFTSDLNAANTRGTSVYVKSTLNAKQVKLPIDSFQDCTWITIQGPDNTSLLIGVIYRSGSPSLAATRDIALHETLKWAANTNNTHLLITGDFNHPSINWTPAPQLPNIENIDNPAFRFVECVRDTYLHQHVTQPTRFRIGQTPTLDDLVFSNEPGMVEQLVHYEPLGASDHARLEFKFIFNTTLPEKKRTIWNYGSADYDKMREDLNLDWEGMLAGKTTQVAFDILQARIMKAVKDHVPSKTIDSKKKKFKPPWMKKEAFRKARKKQHAWIRYLNTKSRNDWAAYTKARNAATHALRQARREFERNLAREARTNNKAFWGYVNSRRKTKTYVGDLKDAYGNFTTNDIEKAEALNEQYSNTFTQEDCSNTPEFEPKHLHNTQETVNITVDMVLNQLKPLRIDKSPGNDELHPRVLKEVAQEIAKPLTMIFQSSITNSELPEQWREANITPVFKKGSKSDPANYRPVSLTSVVCKILERLIAEVVIEHIKSNNLTCAQQHGFSKGKSTVTNLLEALDVWTEALSHGLPVDIIFLDYAKAFDTVPHERLLRRVESFGIVGELLQWIRGFLTQRKQRVVVNGTASSWKPVTSGVPQGSVLGPLLFTIFVSDIPDDLHNFVSLFADDTKIYAAVQNCERDSHATCLQADLNTLYEWSVRMQMRFHPIKCKVMHLGRGNPQHEYTMTMEDGTLHTLQGTKEEKDLGVLIDYNLNFSNHVQTQVNKANKILGVVKHTFKYLDKEAFLHLYKSLIRPHLEYASVIWCPKTKRDKDMIERVQRRATRVVQSISHLSYSDRLKALDLPTLYFRRQRTDVIQLYKITHGLDNLQIGNHCNLCDRSMFTSSLSTSTRGHCHKYQIQRSSGPRSNFFPSRVTPTWNKLSASTVTSRTVNIFKSRLAEEWRDHPDLYNYTFTY